MKNSKGILIVALGLLLFVAGAVMWTQRQASATPTITVFKSPTCGCCSKWVDYMRASGYEVEAHDLTDMTTTKNQYSVRPEFASCHTAIVDGYVVEGHVPVEFVTRLLEERPDITGLTVPGMPMGSPGMEGAYSESYDVLAFDKQGNTHVFGHVEAP